MTAVRNLGAGRDFEAEHEFFEERAGILEFEAGYTRAVAERRARAETLARYFGGDAATILWRAAAEGVRVRLVGGTLCASGPAEARGRWLPTLQRFRDEILAILRGRG